MNAASELETDVCIVGSGPAGTTVALELERRGVDCIVLESGERTVDPARQQLNVTTQVGISTDATDANRVRALGGTSALWGGMCRRLDPLDFERRSWVPGSGWPIKLDDLLPHYATAHRILSLPPPNYEFQGSADPLSLAGPDFENIVFFFDREPTRFGPEFGPKLAASSKISVYLDATVCNILTDESGRRVTSVRAMTLGKKRFAVRARRYVLAVGAIETARLLLSSTDTHAQGLGNQNDLVGRYFHQHPVFTGLRLLAFDFKSRSRLHRETKRVLVTRVRPEATQHHGLLNFHVLVGNDLLSRTQAGSGDVRWSARARLFWEQRRHLYAQPESDAAFGRYLGQLERTLSAAGAPWTIFSEVEIRPEQAPNPASRVLLGDERDALGVRRAVIDWRLSALDQDSLRAGTRLLARAVAANGIGRIKAKTAELVLPAPQSGYLHGGHHTYGTTRMSENPLTGVVNTNCRLHSVDNLYVAGSAVFPTTGYANPTLSIVAIAARLAEHLADTRAG